MLLFIPISKSMDEKDQYFRAIGGANQLFPSDEFPQDHW